RLIWEGLQAQVPADVFARSETAVGAMVLVLFGATVLIRDNQRAFYAGIALAVAGSLLVALALIGQHAGLLLPFTFMVTIGFGLYLPYIAIHTIVFERLLAMTRDRGTIAYLITLADAVGYLGVVAVLLGRNFLQPGAAFLPFFLGTSWVIA